MNFEFLRTLQGFINLLQVLIGFAALFASSFIWEGKNLYFQFIYRCYGWQTLILAILFITWVVAILIFLSNLFEKDILGQLGKLRLMIVYGVCLLLLILSASLESWYASKSGKDYDKSIGCKTDILHPRFIAVTVFNWLLVASYGALIVLTSLFV